MASKTISEVVKSKIDLEKAIRELVSDFQIDTGCLVESIELKKSQNISSPIPDIYEVNMTVELPKRA